MSFASYDLTPGNNITLGGLSIASGTTSPASVNNCLQQLMADGKELADDVAAISLVGYATLAGPVFTAVPTYTGRGAFLHHNNAANTSGRVFIQASGGAAPSMSNGDILLEY
jgi:hypothetical protein